jgi:hypothetical protein
VQRDTKVHKFAFPFPLPTVKHNLLSVLEQGTHVELVLGGTPALTYLILVKNAAHTDSNPLTA